MYTSLSAAIYASRNDPDYLGVSVNLVFSSSPGISNRTAQCIDVTIFDDSLVEPYEAFTVTLTTLSTVVELGNDVTTVTITENDSMSRL